MQPCRIPPRNPAKARSGKHAQRGAHDGPPTKTPSSAATTRSSASPWLTREDKKIDTGTTSAGNTVFVIRFA